MAELRRSVLIRLWCEGPRAERAAYDQQAVKIEVYQGCLHGWCVSDGMIYNKVEADRAFGELVTLYAAALT
jgi:carboxymethylenebutenolidase